MLLSIDDVKKIAKLSRLKISEEDAVKFQNDLNKIFPWIEQLSAVNTDNIEPLVGVENQAINMREDVVTETDLSKEIFNKSPSSKYGYFAVPKVVE